MLKQFEQHNWQHKFKHVHFCTMQNAWALCKKMHDNLQHETAIAEHVYLQQRVHTTQVLPRVCTQPKRIRSYEPSHRVRRLSTTSNAVRASAKRTHHYEYEEEEDDEEEE